jgi:hypothetical protein
MNADSGRRAAWLAWALGALVTAMALAALGLDLISPVGKTRTAGLSVEVLFGGLAILLAVLAALIIARQPRNVVGWLLLLPAINLAFGGLANRYLAAFPEAPRVLTLPLWLLVWYSGWSWLLLIFPLVLIPLVFPTGRLLGARWKWVAAALAAQAAYFLFMATFAAQIYPAAAEAATWTVPNPIGFLSDEQIGALIGPWLGVLAVLTLLCVASLFVRYRRSGTMVRTQIKWLLYACGLFALVYVPQLVLPLETATGEPTLVGSILSAAFGFALVAIPAAIAIAILRYRLWDIDVIIRRTLIYSVLTGILGLIYVGGVLVLQPALSRLTGQGSELATVLSTLAIAALFVPARRGVQGFIDRRFYRRKYDAARTLAVFSERLRDEVELEALARDLTGVVQQTMQPASVGLWLMARPPTVPLNSPGTAPHADTGGTPPASVDA